MVTARSSSRVDRLLQAGIAQEEKLRRVADVLHDEAGQALSATGLHLDLLRQELAVAAPAHATRVAGIQDLLGQAMASVRQISQELNPIRVERSGLVPALERLIASQQAIFAGSIHLSFDPSIHLPAGVAIGFYRIATEAVENAVRHSGAKRVQIVLRRRGKAVMLEVRDNGAGFDAARARRTASGLGLHRIRMYALHFGLTFSLVTTPGRGTIVTTSHPG